MEKRANGIAKILKFFDTLFDTLNTDSRKQIYNKPFKTSVHPKSGHIVFWQNAIRNLKNMQYQEPGTNKKIIPPSLKNFILTLEGFIDVSNRLFSIIPHYNTRMLNQDCLENFFGQIRQHRGRLTHPNSTQFTESYKTLFLKQVSGTHSPKGNCEETVDKSLITVNNFNLNTHKSVDIVQDPFLHVQVQKIIQKPLRPTSSKYLCKYVYNAVLRGITCNLCNNYIFKDCKAQNERERYNPSFLKCIEQIWVIGNYMLNNQNINEQTISTIISYINNYVKFSFKCQHTEKIEETLIKTISTLCITQFCKKINNIIKGKEVPQHGIVNGLVCNAAKLFNKRVH